MAVSKAVASMPNLYSRLVGRLPQGNIKFCFAYGSGVIKQANSELSSNVIDFIVAVDDPTIWHRENIEMNAGHYSGLRLLGHDFVSKIQTNFGALVYFNTLIPIREENVMMKYGVVSVKDLETDLLDWCDLYLSGRLHKPVQFVHPPTDTSLRTALQVNLHSAVHTALLLLPEHFTENEFYRKIANISYVGDFRMILGEDKNKVNNIVRGQLPRFRNLYAPVLRSVRDYIDYPDFNVEGEKIVGDGELGWRQDISPSTKLFHLNQLPRTPLRNLVKVWNSLTRSRQDTEDVLHAMAFDPDCSVHLARVLSSIVWNKSITQSLKGILTGGVVKSVKYSAKKLTKMVNSKK